MSGAEAELLSSRLASVLPDLLRSYLREFGSASSIDELAAEIHGLGGVRLQLLLHSHFLSRDACRKPKKRGGVRITCKTRTTSENLQHVGAEREKKSRQRESAVTGADRRTALQICYFTEAVIDVFPPTSPGEDLKQGYEEDRVRDNEGEI